MEGETDQQIYKRIQAENGRKGGQETLKRHGVKHFEKASKKAKEALKQAPK